MDSKHLVFQRVFIWVAVLSVVAGGCLRRRHRRKRTAVAHTLREPTPAEVTAGQEALRLLKRSPELFRGRHMARLCALRYLRDLDFRGAAVTSGMLKCLSLFKNLEYLNLEGTAVDDELFTTLAPLRRLAILNVEKTAVTGWKLEQLAASSSLRRLNLSRNRIHPHALELLQGLQGLRRLSLRSLRERIPLASLRNLRLTHLDLSGTKVVPGALTALASLSSLEVLDISGISVAASDAAAIGKLTRVRILHAAGCSLTDAHASFFFASRHLVDLDLSANRITGHALRSLARTPSLERLALSGSAFVERDVVGQKIRFSKPILAGISLQDLPWPRNLRTLSLPITDLADDNLVFLEKLPFLRELDIGQTLVTRDGAARLRKSHPKVTLTWLPLLPGTYFVPTRTAPIF